VDLAPRQVYAQLLDEGRHLCSLRTMYRILEENREVRQRRDQLRHPEYKSDHVASVVADGWRWTLMRPELQSLYAEFEKKRATGGALLR
jgi:putative transposase